MVEQLSAGFLSLGELFEANCLAGKSPEDNYPWGKLHGGDYVRIVLQGELFRDNCQGGTGLGGISWEQLSRVGLFKGDCLGGGGKSPEGIVLGGISWGGGGVNYPGGSCSGGNCH